MGHITTARTVLMHSHPKVAGVGDMAHGKHYAVSTHSHQKVAATARTTSGEGRPVSTHSHPKVAGLE